jgi:hypothetical protein
MGIRSNRREAVEKLLTTAGGKLVAMYGTIAKGPGAMAIFDIDPAAAPAVVGVIASCDALQNVEMQRLFSGEEVRAVRQKRAQLLVRAVLTAEGLKNLRKQPPTASGQV